MPVKEIAIVAIIATNSVSEGAPQSKVLYGGDLARVATERCIADKRDIYEGFVLVSDYQSGYFKVNCQVLETTTGDYYAAKGAYHEYSDMMKTLINLFESY